MSKHTIKGIVWRLLENNRWRTEVDTSTGRYVAIIKREFHYPYWTWGVYIPYMNGLIFQEHGYDNDLDKAMKVAIYKIHSLSYKKEEQMSRRIVEGVEFRLQENGEWRADHNGHIIYVTSVSDDSDFYGWVVFPYTPDHDRMDSLISHSGYSSPGILEDAMKSSLIYI